MNPTDDTTTVTDPLPEAITEQTWSGQIGLCAAGVAYWMQKIGRLQHQALPADIHQGLLVSTAYLESARIVLLQMESTGHWTSESSDA